ncbi:TBL3 [Cordylochernes scorpioides]|uniref:TBL3 n=1 Tax=Cordylochernes scorpioides TaxID=51811 RepID=A0ABY6LMB2_9ARAC|nr:TBL3 [Cordylochernes scorpioides]
MDIKNVQKWCREFNEGRINVHDEQRSGLPSLPESTVARIVEMVRANRRITLEEIEDGLNEDCSHFSVHKIVSETLGYRKVSARWVDKWLKEAAGEWYNTGITNYVIQAKHEPFYTNKDIMVSKDGTRLYCHNGCRVSVIDLASGKPIFFLKKEDDMVETFTLPPSEAYVLLACESDYIHQFDSQTGQLRRSWKPVESVFLLPQGQLSALNIPHSDYYHVLTAGSQGTLKVWDLGSESMVYHQEETPMKAQDESENENITKAMYVPALKSVMVATADRMILFFKLDNGLTLTKQMVGKWGPNSMRFLGPNSEFLALASPSSTVAIHHVDTFQCQLLTGHSDLVLALDVFPTDPCLLVSGGKDNTAIVWKLDPKTGKAAVIFMAIGHTANVTTVACTRGSTDYFASADLACKLKLWKMKRESQRGRIKMLTTKSSVAAHKEKINALDFSRDDELVASASRDKLVKVWSVPLLELQGTLTGHTRGIYDVKFCPIDDQLASASEDGTIKIWSLSTMNCLRTLQDHQCSVTSLSYLKSGLHLAAGDVSGVLRVFDLTHKINYKTIVLSEYDAGIHSLALSLGTDDLLATTDTGSNLVLWKLLSVNSLGKSCHLNHSLGKSCHLNHSLGKSGHLNHSLGKSCHLNHSLGKSCHLNHSLGKSCHLNHSLGKSCHLNHSLGKSCHLNHSLGKSCHLNHSLGKSCHLNHSLGKSCHLNHSLGKSCHLNHSLGKSGHLNHRLGKSCHLNHSLGKSGHLNHRLGKSCHLNHSLGKSGHLNHRLGKSCHLNHSLGKSGHLNHSLGKSCHLNHRLSNSRHLNHRLSNSRHLNHRLENSRHLNHSLGKSRRLVLGPMQVQLLHPVSRFKQVQSLQHLCRYSLT